MNVIETETSLHTVVPVVKSEEGLQDLVYRLVSQIIVREKGKNMTNLLEEVLAVVEPPLLKAVMEKRRGNQLQAAKILGISRGTIRKKLQKYFGSRYFRLTEE
jgi:Fis family transcriptional regulator